ncbi:MAG: hypothetical protein BGO49_21025 [Planctomycetales bacterium 71-10]|nr:MAG: hypothetical protein BGO49_21025 [Planctomycetales bacterium 71-10]
MLDNPAWAALTTRQESFALGDGRARRYPAEVAPFLAVADPGPEAAAAARALVKPGESLHFVGVAPGDLQGWDVERTSTIAQMVFEGRATEIDGEDMTTLGAADVPEMLALMAAVYPGYFRPRTRELGLYLGVRREERLVAMAGQRMGLDGYREISAVATLPEFRGRGYAGRLVGRLVREIRAEVLAPFLHVDTDNTAARAAYEKVGFAWRRDLTVVKVRRRDD